MNQQLVFCIPWKSFSCMTQNWLHIYIELPYMHWTGRSHTATMSCLLQVLILLRPMPEIFSLNISWFEFQHVYDFNWSKGLPADKGPQLKMSNFCFAAFCFHGHGFACFEIPFRHWDTGYSLNSVDRSFLIAHVVSRSHTDFNSLINITGSLPCRYRYVRPCWKLTHDPTCNRISIQLSYLSARRKFKRFCNQ